MKGAMLEAYKNLMTRSKIRVLEIARSTINPETHEKPEQHEALVGRVELEMIRDRLTTTQKVAEVDFVNKWLTDFDDCTDLVNYAGLATP